MPISGFKESPEENNVDLLDKFVTKSYLLDVYKNLTEAKPLETGLFAFGKDMVGQLGDNSTIDKSSPIVSSASTAWKRVECGDYHAVGIKTDGTLWCFGFNDTGQLGDYSMVNKSSPVQTVCGGNNWKQASCGSRSSSAIKTDGTLWVWGGNWYGELGDSSSAFAMSPVQTVCGGNNWKLVSLGQYYAFAIKTDGTLWGWGINESGQLGDGTTVNKSSPVQTTAGGSNWKSVSCASWNTLAIKTNGTLWKWGYGAYVSPVEAFAGTTNWKFISNGYTCSAGIKTDGTLWTWGNNNYGQAGTGTASDSVSLTQTIAKGNNWRLVHVGFDHLSAIKTDGTLWLWGRNNFGQLGDNTRTNRSSPIQTIIGGSNWKSVSCGREFSIAAK